MTHDLEQFIRDNFYYHPTTGQLWRKWKTCSRVVGQRHTCGYLQCRILHHNLLVHRVCWFLYYGAFPTNEIDHINMIKDDNRIANMREATHSSNTVHRNKRKNCTSQYKGVNFDKFSGRWLVRVGSKHIGRYDTEEQAAKAYDKYATLAYGQFTVLNLPSD